MEFNKFLTENHSVFASHINHVDKRDIYSFNSDIADSVSRNVIPEIRLFDILLRIQTGV